MEILELIAFSLYISVEDGILDQIELSSGRGVSFLKSQSSSFKFPDDDAPVTADVGVGSGVVKSRGGSIQPSLSRVASEMIPEGENEEESVGEGIIISFIALSFCLVTLCVISYRILFLLYNRLHLQHALSCIS